MAAHISIVIPALNPDGNLAICLRMIDDQEVENVEVILVDDGSTPAIDSSLVQHCRTPLRILRFQKSRGRSAARNAGAHAATGDVLVFIDCDCAPTSPHWLKAHVSAIAAGAIAGTGPLLGDSSAFWDRYQRETSERRQAQHASGVDYAGTTANLSIRSKIFAKVGGFDEQYSGYGFEDRDLLLRLSELGRIEWINASVNHMDALRLFTIYEKFLEAGGIPAKIFHDRHIDAYKQLGYARLDTRIHPSLRPLAPLAGTVARCAARVGDAAIARDLMPFAIGRLWVKATTALAFLAGTARG